MLLSLDVPSSLTARDERRLARPRYRQQPVLRCVLLVEMEHEFGEVNFAGMGSKSHLYEVHVFVTADISRSPICLRREDIGRQWRLRPPE